MKTITHQHIFIVFTNKPCCSPPDLIFPAADNDVRQAPHGRSRVRTCRVEKTNRTQQMVICMIYFRTFAEDIGGRGRFMRSRKFWDTRTRIQQARRRQSGDLDERPQNVTLANKWAASLRLLFSGGGWQVLNFAFPKLVVILIFWFQRLAPGLSQPLCDSFVILQHNQDSWSLVGI